MVQPSWNGTYTYVASSGHTVGGSAIVTEYTLAISPNDVCSIRIAGYQVNEEIKCRVAISGRKAIVQFVSFADGGSGNEFGVVEYALGERLFILSRDADELSTEWIRLTPDAVTENPGSYFHAASPEAQTGARSSAQLACARFLHHQAEDERTTDFDVSREVGDLKSPHSVRFRNLTSIDVPCTAPSPLPDEDEQQLGHAKAIRAGRSNGTYWVAYVYPAERVKANLYGYMTALVRFDSRGRPVSSQAVSELIAYEGYVRHVRSTMENGLIRTCIREAELFAYEANGDIGDELPIPRSTEEACGAAHPIGGTDGRSSFPLTTVKQCQRDGASVDFCDERHTALMSEALREQAPGFDGHYILTAIPEGKGRASFVAIDANDGVAYPLPFDSAEVGSTGEGGKKSGYRLRGQTICFDGPIHVDRSVRVSAGCYQLTSGSFERIGPK